MTTMPLPPIDDEIGGRFWAEAQAGRFVLQRCDTCGYVRWPPSSLCPECLAEETSWIGYDGGGTVWSYIFYHRAYREEFRPLLPYCVAVIDLDAGPKFIGNVVAVGEGDMVIGARVRLRFDALAENVWVPKWELAQGA